MPFIPGYFLLASDCLSLPDVPASDLPEEPEAFAAGAAWLPDCALALSPEAGAAPMDGTESDEDDLPAPEVSADGTLGAEPADEFEEPDGAVDDWLEAPFWAGAVGTVGTAEAGGVAGASGALAGADLKPCITPPSNPRECG